MNTDNHYDVIVVGGGPAGLTAAIYLSRAKLKTLIVNEGTIGGQMILTHQIANYPGVENVSGYQLSSIMRKQAESFGARILSNKTIKSIDLGGGEKMVVLDSGETFTAASLILALGGRSRTLGLPREESFKGKGISYCATCDGDFFTNKEIIVVGGGNSALEEAVSLTKYAKKVTVVHHLAEFEASKHAIEEAQQNERVHFVMESTVTAFHGSENIEGVDITNKKTGEITRFDTDGVFIFIGYLPNTEAVRGQLALNNRGEIIVGEDMATSVEGVYAAGDCNAKRFRQITTAVSDGTIAALSAASYVEKLA